jgi:hypothetical protein
VAGDGSVEEMIGAGREQLRTGCSTAPSCSGFECRATCPQLLAFGAGARERVRDGADDGGVEEMIGAGREQLRTGCSTMRCSTVEQPVLSCSGFSAGMREDGGNRADDGGVEE